MDRNQGSPAGRAGKGGNSCGATEGFCSAGFHTGRLQRGTVEFSSLGPSVAPAAPAHGRTGGDRARAARGNTAPDQRARYAWRRRTRGPMQDTMSNADAASTVAVNLAPPAPFLPHAMRALRALVVRELLKFSMQYGRLISALVRPLLWLAVFAAVFRNVFGVSIVPPYDTYISYDVYIAPGLDRKSVV